MAQRHLLYISSNGLRSQFFFKPKTNFDCELLRSTSPPAAINMPAHTAPSPSAQPNPKRQRQNSSHGGSPRNRLSPSEQNGDPGLDSTPSGPLTGGKPNQSSNFRNVSACNRCRLRKNRCDQKLPSCASCAKAGVACVGYDPITKKEIPRR